MSRVGRYWLFFVIVAVGLALSWGQVGRKTQRVLLDDPVVYLQTETDCQPDTAPCAAVGRDRAVVLGPTDAGLLARTTGLDDAVIIEVEVIMLGADGATLGRRALVADAPAWPVADLPAGTRLLRYRITANKETTVAEFPL